MAQGFAGKPITVFIHREWHRPRKFGRGLDPVLKADTPVYVDESGAWGPSAGDQKVSPAGGWQNSHGTRCGANGPLPCKEECEHANRG